MSTPDLQDVHDYLVAIANEAGEMIRSARPKATGLGTKKNSADLVTETDQAVEKMVSTRLRARFPDYQCDRYTFSSLALAASSTDLRQVHGRGDVQAWRQAERCPDVHR